MSTVPFTVRRLFTVLPLLSAAVTGLCLAALTVGAVSGPRWLLLVGLLTSALVLAAFGAIGEAGITTTQEVAWPLREGGPRAYAPAVVHRVRAVDRTTNGPAGDPRSPDSAFEFDLTVVPPAGHAPYRIRLRHPLDLQGLLHRDRAVVEYDPQQPWRVILPNNPPAEHRSQATHLPAPPPARTLHPKGLPPGALVLALGLVAGAALVGAWYGAG
ncbi:hypothetical protein ACMA1D_15945 [Streptomyces sp. 796.1]|uniref:hypothetical protein n=1 Tax=Streptomyces sp. 796.1 TaxID=3163029 RepID=UPI0039C8DECC